MAKKKWTEAEILRKRAENNRVRDSFMEAIAEDVEMEKAAKQFPSLQTDSVTPKPKKKPSVIWRIGRKTMIEMFALTKENFFALILTLVGIAVYYGRYSPSLEALKNNVWDVILPWALGLCLLFAWHVVKAAISVYKEETIVLPTTDGDMITKPNTWFRIRLIAATIFYLLMSFGFSYFIVQRASVADERISSQGSAPLTSENAFSVAVETRIFSMPGDNGTSFWVRSRGISGCALEPANAVLFIRITNLQLDKTLITAYHIESSGVVFNRLPLTIGKVFQIVEHGVMKPTTESDIPIQFPVPQGIGSMVKFPLKDADPSIAKPIDATFLDTQLSDNYLGPNQTIRGWAFFQYPKHGSGYAPAQMTIKISDARGHTFSYEIDDNGGDTNGDTLLRTMRHGPTIDLSACTLDR